MASTSATVKHSGTGFPISFLVKSGRHCYNASMNARRMLVIAAAAALLAACSVERLNLGAPNALSREKAAQLVVGKTTKAETEGLLGKPLDVLVIDGVERHFYKDFNLRALHVEFDKNGVVSSYKYSD